MVFIIYLLLSNSFSPPWKCLGSLYIWNHLDILSLGLYFQGIVHTHKPHQLSCTWRASLSFTNDCVGPLNCWGVDLVLRIDTLCDNHIPEFSGVLLHNQILPLPKVMRTNPLVLYIPNRVQFGHNEGFELFPHRYKYISSNLSVLMWIFHKVTTSPYNFSGENEILYSSSILWTLK